MRTLLLAALSLSSLTPSRDADACGGYTPEPRVMRLSTHFIANVNDQRRTFVLFGDASDSPKLSWRLLAPGTYDATQIADGEHLTNPLTFTVVGTKGARVVRSSKHVFLSRSWDFDKPQHAIDVGDIEGFSIAIEGEHDASWIALEDRQSQRAMAKWVTARGITANDPASIYVSRVAGTDFETVTLFHGKKMLTFLKQGEREIGRYVGTPMGAVTIDGTTTLVLVDGAQTRQVYLGNTI